jgi:hypothetical protein
MKILIALMFFLLCAPVCRADGKPMFYQGTIDAVDQKGFSMTDTHGQKMGFDLRPAAPVYDIGGKTMPLVGLHAADRVKVLFRRDDPGHAVAVYRLEVLTKQEKAAYSEAHRLDQK